MRRGPTVVTYICGKCLMTIYVHYIGSLFIVFRNSVLIGLVAMIVYTGFIFFPRYYNNILDYSGYMAGS